MSAYDLLSELRQAGVVVKASGTDRLVVDAPKGALTPEMRAALAEHKKELPGTARAGVGSVTTVNRG